MPIVQSLRFVSDLEGCSFSRRHARRAAGAVGSVLQSDRHVVNCENEIVVDGLGGRKVQGKTDRLILVSCVAKRICTVEADLVGAIPQQSFLPVLEIQIDSEMAAFKWQHV